VPDAQFLAHPTVGRYARSIDDLPAADQARRLGLIADFATFGRRPLPEKPSWMVSE
jgi:hypothetical protein